MRFRGCPKSPLNVPGPALVSTGLPGNSTRLDGFLLLFILTYISDNSHVMVGTALSSILLTQNSCHCDAATEDHGLP
jgi:hypothetical protein